PVSSSTGRQAHPGARRECGAPAARRQRMAERSRSYSSSKHSRQRDRPGPGAAVAVEPLALADALDDRRGGDVVHVGQDVYLAAQLVDERRFGQRLRRVVAALDEDVGADDTNQRGGGILGKGY